MGNDLTAKQLKFVEGMLIHGKGGKAAIHAGYSKKSAAVTASRLLKDQRILTALESARAERASRTGSDPDQVIEKLWATYDRAAAAGRDAAACKALELIGKHSGMFTDRVEHVADPAATGPVDLLTAARLIAFGLRSGGADLSVLDAAPVEPVRPALKGPAPVEH